MTEHFLLCIDTPESMDLTKIIFPSCFEVDLGRAEDEEDGTWAIPIDIVDNDGFYRFLIDNNFQIDVLEETFDVSYRDVINRFSGMIRTDN
jgi:hypothetical protein